MRGGMPDAEKQIPIQGRLFLEGTRFGKDARTALDCFEAATKAGHPRVPIVIGMMHILGDVVPRDTLLGYAWLVSGSQGIPPDLLPDISDQIETVERILSLEELQSGEAMIERSVRFAATSRRSISATIFS